MLPAILASRAALGVPDPLGTLAAFFISAEQGGVFMMKVEVHPGLVYFAARIQPECSS